MQEKLISYETANLAKEKGFNINVINFYDNKILNIIENRYKNNEVFQYNPINWNGTKPNLHSAPTQSFLQKWLREVHDLDIEIETVWVDNKKEAKEFSPWVLYRKEDSHLEDDFPIYLKTYEEALEIALQEALKLIK